MVPSAHLALSNVCCKLLALLKRASARQQGMPAVFVRCFKGLRSCAIETKDLGRSHVAGRPNWLCYSHLAVSAAPGSAAAEGLAQATHRMMVPSTAPVNTYGLSTPPVHAETS